MYTSGNAFVPAGQYWANESNEDERKSTVAIISVGYIELAEILKSHCLNKE